MILRAEKLRHCETLEPPKKLRHCELLELPKKLRQSELLELPKKRRCELLELSNSLVEGWAR
jgi:hypothetical protein